MANQVIQHGAVGERRWVIGICAAVVVGLTACAGPTSASTSSTPATSTSSPTNSTLTATSTSSSVVIGQSTCRINQLRISPGKAGAAAGNIGQTIVFTNVGESACIMTGYPGVAALDAQGHQVVQAQRRRSGMLGGLQNSGTPIPVVTLAPGQMASAEIEGGDNPIGAATSCPTYPSFLVTPPGETHSAQISAGVAGSGAPGFQGCGTISVNPVVQGTTGSLS